MQKLKPWLKFIEGDEGGAATDTTQDANTGEVDQSQPGDEPEVDWKAKYEAMRSEMRKQEERAKANKDAAEKLKKLEEAGDAGGQDDADELAKAQQEVAAAQMEVRRYKMAAKYGLSDEQAELYLTDPDEERMEAQAQGLADMVKKPKRRDLGDAGDRTPPAPTLKTGADLYDRVKANLY